MGAGEVAFREKEGVEAPGLSQFRLSTQRVGIEIALELPGR
jgi:hypothetical protein